MEAHILAISEYGHKKASRSGNSNGHINEIPSDDLISINNGVDNWIFLQSHGSSFNKETHKSQFYTVFLKEILSEFLILYKILLYGIIELIACLLTGKLWEGRSLFGIILDVGLHVNEDGTLARGFIYVMLRKLSWQLAWWQPFIIFLLILLHFFVLELIIVLLLLFLLSLLILMFIGLFKWRLV